MELSDALHPLRALGHPLRLRAFREPVRRGNTGLVVGDLRELLQIPPATLSAHLNVLWRSWPARCWPDSWRSH